MGQEQNGALGLALGMGGPEPKAAADRCPHDPSAPTPKLLHCPDAHISLLTSGVPGLLHQAAMPNQPGSLALLGPAFWSPYTSAHR